ncbi:hypothetical protein A2331_01690 [Candidatus Falkowbacteria bacterium RIFOXYB2_FULL_34_18]|uniref:Radical SAM core domain-containing protein n=1 Tax=Candidatus Falkowbacteria bacterium RIFOXYD2_FULL_34_120 TaxID=1798007 RepID=A0A1F5TQ19_9BACT|nr:MAG: hypothetical protein A2331_01690 [Candidatus Falkowbacteria bacterium RIFOXYB2_FULL_34_18]OGF29324.1 MAG: hypothetical protein A2500_05570 [Candidatus Falkowbacteria bacterium RIFOXYC12_FULL_34_55]OGF36440.1 MAG: hypothetical protein A2466_01230 [Candidatus Falkowbacteria bacterium RIFOXYC2_FULL_34_220]OGF38919.1 MAG: hypothetical protein A2515_05990 [Candidatus Falkowbacteria bacterium RIFOXYD12_FULL_34_57]OGF40938.1 MAG: hypothetical protein A2531_04215 [Candidatus Falkowbacteria bact
MINIKQFIATKNKFFNIFQLFGNWSPQPLFLLVHITLRCDNVCGYCYQLSDDYYKKYLAQDLSFDDFKKIVIDAKRNFFVMPKIHLFGGEPLINKDFSKMLEFATLNNVKLSFTTNGNLLNIFYKDIGSSSIEQINVSMNSLEDFYKIKTVQDIKRIKININFVLTDKNYKEIKKIVDFFEFEKANINVLSFQHAYFCKDKININVLKDQIFKIKNLKTRFKILFLPYIKVNDLEKYYNKELNNFSRNCNIPWLGLNIMPNLDVTPGGGVLGCNNVIGNLKKEKIKIIWNNKKIKIFRKNILKNGVCDKCLGCCHRQYY